EITRGVGTRDNIAVAQLGKNYFQRFSESIENANGVFQRHDRCGWRGAVRGLVENKGELGLRILGMNQEGGAAIDVAAQQAESLVGGVPGLDYDVVPFVAQEVFHHA